MKMDHDTLRKVQLIELELLEEADRICKKFHISYNIIAGTLLGAVRHGGFIPWDDDAYLRFKFGNYMELPPESEQKVHPVSALEI